MGRGKSLVLYATLLGDGGRVQCVPPLSFVCNEHIVVTVLLQVCGSDGVTYQDVATLRAQGGNVRVDYRGPCDDSDSDQDDTPATRCKMVKDVRKMCPNITGCARMVMPSDGCCPMCGKCFNSLQVSFY